MYISSNKKRFSILFSALLILASCLYCQNIAEQSSGTISGKITEEETGAPLVGANIFAFGTNAGAATDIHGEYRFTIEEGVYRLQASCIGYMRQFVDSVKVRKRQIVHIDFQLSYRDPDSLIWQVKARRDIAAGDVHLIGIGLRVIPLPESLYNPIAARYRLRYLDDGTYMPAARSYNQIVYSYLDSVNGPGWRERLDADIAATRQKLK